LKIGRKWKRIDKKALLDCILRVQRPGGYELGRHELERFWTVGAASVRLPGKTAGTSGYHSIHNDVSRRSTALYLRDAFLPSGLLDTPAADRPKAKPRWSYTAKLADGREIKIVRANLISAIQWASNHLGRRYISRALSGQYRLSFPVNVYLTPGGVRWATSGSRFIRLDDAGRRDVAELFKEYIADQQAPAAAPAAPAPAAAAAAPSDATSIAVADVRRSMLKPADKAPDSTDSKFVCTVCMANYRNVVLHPCKHAVLCTQCFLSMRDAAASFTCPNCRAVAERVSPMILS